MKAQTLSAASFVLVASLFSTIPSFAQTTTHTKYSLVAINKAKLHVTKHISTLHFPTNKTNELTPAQMNQANREINAITPTTKLKQKPQYTFTVKDKTIIKTFAVYNFKKEKYVYLIGYVPVSTKPITKPKPKITPPVKPNPYAGMYYVPYPSTSPNINVQLDGVTGDTFMASSNVEPMAQQVSQTLSYIGTPIVPTSSQLTTIAQSIATAPYGICIPVYTNPSQIKYMPNVLFISSMDTTSIKNLQAVWSQIKPTPAVIWDPLTVQSAPMAWKMLGYNGDPLPSWYTAYTAGGGNMTQANLKNDESQANPDFFHWDGKGWIVLTNGAWLQPNNVPGLVTFFNYVAPGNITPPTFQYKSYNTANPYYTPAQITKLFDVPDPSWPPLVNGQLASAINNTTTTTTTTSSSNQN